MTVRVSGKIVVSEGGSSAVERSGLLLGASSASNIAAQEKLVRGRAGAGDKIEGYVVETLTGAKAAAAGQFG